MLELSKARRGQSFPAQIHPGERSSWRGWPSTKYAASRGTMNTKVMLAITLGFIFSAGAGTYFFLSSQKETPKTEANKSKTGSEAGTSKLATKDPAKTPEPDPISKEENKLLAELREARDADRDDPRYCQCLVKLGEFYEKQGNYAESESYFEAA